ncbi:hypothetical protein N9Y67_03035 [Pseudomonadota bacterium]|nr:hypothetical protein [Pseudomonadota bacterium]
MAKPAPSLIPAFLALLIIILFGYLIFTDLKPSRTEHTLPAIEIIDPPEQLPLTVIEDEKASMDNADIIQQEAELFVEQLSPVTPSAIAINEGTDQFVRHDSLLTLPNIEQRTTSLPALLADSSLSDDTPITLNFMTEKSTVTTLDQLSKAVEDHTAIITIIDSSGHIISQPLADILNQRTIKVSDEIRLVEQHAHHFDTTFSKLAELDISPEQTLVASITLGANDIALSELIPATAQNKNALYYIHRVTNKDGQGLWGIIQTGLINKFRQGLQIKGVMKNKELAHAIIPADADEKLASGISSFLGKILYNKVDNSFIYNFHTRVMGRNANLIHPGQQVILIEFTADELAGIYQFFSDKRNQGIETFAITN